ncbi:bifunctional homocysteine S-methyltransferase/methylenetetrahydrofolate reductase [Desulfitobacterium metallireducens]|uniref:5,10-methylenetetrahydrofolate reductase n=1 Tax=Desulfitobacterium metallireducens DSM 15288 TaxID=871968 RepID=W0EAP2_9FIRM|nr:bifunctional homocysteine S-methyltransferase/methylenetetrahydrofolate reductase [Desulfitobacterium metallireducens]AHF06274.1 5,10-methylenetetrahydrofolate reductase [Desulfitobacterium metallireducens DSM 15288]
MTFNNLREHLQQHVVIGDGAMATLLYQFGVPVGSCYEELNLTHPALIRSVHEAYIRAGAQLIETNTFRVNREVLTRFGLEQKVGEINRTAVKVAQEAVAVAEKNAFIIGSMGSILAGRVRTEPLVSYRSLYEEQASALLESGVDGIMLETFEDLEELLLVLELMLSLTDRPILAHLATPQVGRTRDGYTVTRSFELMRKAGADVIGLNCRLGPTEMLRTLEQTQVPEGALLSIFPNAGRSGFVEGKLSFKSSPEYFADYALRLRDEGVRLIGGCCGTTPDHIRAIAQALQELSPIQRVNPDLKENNQDKEKDQVRFHIQPQAHVKAYTKDQRTIIERAQEEHTVIVEFDSPKGLNTEDFFNGCQALDSAGAAAITLADNSLANVRMSNLALGALLKERYDIEPLLHVACRDRNLIGQQSHLMGLHALGIHQILVITGDPSRYGDLPGASSVFDSNSFELIRMTKQLNEGLSFSGQAMNHSAQFIVGTAFNPYVRNFETAIQRLERKIEAGADFVMTQPVYDGETLQKIYEGTKHLPIPVFVGIMPLTSQRNAEFLHNEVPGISLTEEALQRMSGLKGEKARQEGIAMSKELLDQAVKVFNGIYLITPFNYYKMTAELTEYVLNICGNSNGEKVEFYDSACPNKNRSF